jgi:hypothetical protein
MQVPIYCKHAENRAFGNLYGISVLEPSFDFDLDKKEGHGCSFEPDHAALSFFRTPAIILFRESLPNLHIIISAEIAPQPCIETPPDRAIYANLGRGRLRKE